MSDQEKICDNNESTPSPAEDEEEAEMVDPHQRLRDVCKQKAECSKLFQKLTTCNERVESRTKTAETCAEELIDFVECVDHCAAKNLFKFLK